MNEIKIFSSPQFGEIRTATTENGEPLFCAPDITSILGYKNGRKAVSDNCNAKGVTTSDTLTNGGVQKLTYINEANLYRLVMKSKLPEAEIFQDWVCEEVLPSIRKTGGYIATTETDTPELIMARALMVASDTINRVKAEKELLAMSNRVLEAKNIFQECLLDEQAPRVIFSRAVETSSSSCLVAELAKIICANGVSIGQNRLFEWMRKNGYLCTKGDYYNRPTQKAMEMHLFELKTSTRTLADGTVFTDVTTKVTGKGQVYFVNKFILQLEPA